MARADSLFSQYIRLAYSFPAGGVCRSVRCVTCGRVSDWREADCGHYMSRRHLSTRWDVRNCRPQCPECNRLYDGRPEQFRAALVQEMGEENVEEVEQLAHCAERYTEADLKELCCFLRASLTRLKERINNEQ